MSITKINDVVCASVTADEPLSSLIDDSQKYQIENLKVSGKLNGDDILFLREMAGGTGTGETNNDGNEFDDYEKTDNDGVLKVLDLSEAFICEGGGYYYYYRYRSPKWTNIDPDLQYTKKDKISPYMFYNCKSLTSIILPASITFIGRKAFVGCDNLKEIHFKSDVPPKLEEVSALDEIFPLNRYKELFTTIYIPKGSKAAYDNEEQPWNLFPQIIEE